MFNKPEAIRVIDEFLDDAAITHPIPQIIIGGVDYTGVPKAEVFAHLARMRAERHA